MAGGAGVSPDFFSPLRGPPQAGRESLKSFPLVYQVKKERTIRRPGE